MKILYELTVECGCPVDGGGDIYQCSLTATKPIPVESILSVVSKCRDLQVFQEVLADRLSRELLCGVRLVGYHSGVKVTVDA